MINVKKTIIIVISSSLLFTPISSNPPRQAPQRPQAQKNPMLDFLERMLPEEASSSSAASRQPASENPAPGVLGQAFQGVLSGAASAVDAVGGAIGTLIQEHQNYCSTQIGLLNQDLEFLREPKGYLSRRQDSESLKSEFLKEACRQVRDRESLIKIAEERLVALKRENTMLAESARKGFGAALNIATETAKINANKATEVEKSAVTTHIKWQKITDFLSSRSNLSKISAAVALAAVGVYTAKEGSKVTAHYLETIIGKPRLVKESSVDSYWERFKRSFLKITPAQSNINDVIVHPDIQTKLKKIALSTKYAKANQDPLMHVLFYGPPGIGKTMYAKELAKYADMEYAIMSGADFSQFKDGDDITELHKLFDWARNSKKGLIIFIDEADSFLRNRGSESASQKSINLTNAFLSRVEKQTANNIMFIFATNHPQTLDSAVFSRIAPNNRIEFYMPEQEERKAILNLYLQKYAHAKNITIEPAVEEHSEQLAKEINGLSGRDIEGAVIQMIRELRLQQATVLTLDIVRTVLRDTAESKKKESNYGK